MANAALAPKLEFIASWKDAALAKRFKGRSDLIAYAEAESIDISVTLEKPCSSGENLLLKSYALGLLEDPRVRPCEGMFSVCKRLQAAPDRKAVMASPVKDGLPIELVCDAGKTRITKPWALFEKRNILGAEHGIGRIDIAENRFIGIKSRGVYETPRGTILHAARCDAKGVTLDAEVLRLRDSLSKKLTQLIYNSFWFGPEMAVVRCARDKCVDKVDGTVLMARYEGNAMAIGRTSPRGLYDQDLSSINVKGEFNQADAQGFMHLHALRVKAHRRQRGELCALSAGAFDVICARGLGDSFFQAAADATAAARGAGASGKLGVVAT